MNEHDKISSLSSAIVKAMEEYSDALSESVAKAADIVSKDLTKSIREDAPVLTGDYKKGWHRKRKGGGWVVYNKTDYQLTHLLERGHKQKHGKTAGKTYKPVKGYEHILKNRARAAERFEKLCATAASGKQISG